MVDDGEDARGLTVSGRRLTSLILLLCHDFGRDPMAAQARAQRVGFAKRGGATGVVLVNAMAFSSPYPDEVVEVSERRDDDGVRVDVYGAENDVAIDWTRSSCAK